MGDGLGSYASYFAGFALGFLGGLVPGLHSNTLISILASLGYEGHALAFIIIALFPAHLVSSFIPAIFFGVPDADNAASSLPGHRLVRMGMGAAALRAVLLAALLAGLLAAALLLPSISFFPAAYSLIRPHLGRILLALSIFLLARTRKPLLSALIFLLSGILGSICLRSGLQDPFLPLFSGMFAMAAIASYRRGEVQGQAEGCAGGDGHVARTVPAGVALGMLADLMPGIGSPSQVAAFSTIFMRSGPLGYLSLISSISVSQAVFSLATSTSIGKSRVGATAWLAQSIDVGANLPMLAALFIISLAAASLLAFAARRFLVRFADADFSGINVILASYLALITLAIDGPAGLLFLALATGVGLICLRLGVERTNLMGAIIVPTLMLLFGVFT
ncbi:MAG: tripartite tricarboxylate transporter permease [Candidatus Micrarchaeota archaeon]